MAGLLVLAPFAAQAQVTVNPAALQQLAGIVPQPPTSAAPALPLVRHRPHFHRVVQAVAHAKPAAPVQVAARVVAPPAPKAAPLPAPAAPKPLAPISLVFTPGSADLPASATAALKPFCAAKNRIAIDARAPADPNDPSAAMRLSLSRALAVQGVLTACGVPPQNILPRANGDVPGANEDETVIGSSSAK